MLPLEQRNMYSDPYQGSYHLFCLREAKILSSLHYRRMTSAQRHGSNYIIQAHNTPAARQHQTPSTFSLLALVFFLSSLSSCLLFFTMPLLLFLLSLFLSVFPFICSVQQCQRRRAVLLIPSTLSSEAGEHSN